MFVAALVWFLDHIWSRFQTQEWFLITEPVKILSIVALSQCPSLHNGSKKIQYIRTRQYILPSILQRSSTNKRYERDREKEKEICRIVRGQLTRRLKISMVWYNHVRALGNCWFSPNQIVWDWEKPVVSNSTSRAKTLESEVTVSVNECEWMFHLKKARFFLQPLFRWHSPSMDWTGWKDRWTPK